MQAATAARPAPAAQQPPAPAQRAALAAARPGRRAQDRRAARSRGGPRPTRSSRLRPAPPLHGRHHGCRPALAVRRELRTPLERGARQIPGGGVDQTREAGESGAGLRGGNELLQMHQQLLGERMRGMPGGAALAFGAPPFQARMGHVMVQPRAHAGGDLPLDPAQRGQHRLLGRSRVEPGEEAGSVGLRLRGHRSDRRRRSGAAAARSARAPPAPHRR